MRRIAALVTTFTLVLAFPASAGGPNNVVIASPTADGAQLIRTAVKAGSTGAESVTSSNLAVAKPSNCTGCEGIAVAYQAVVVTGNPSEVSPANAALAVNTACTSCGAFAYAYQYVVTADPGSRLSSAGQSKITAIRAEAARLARAGLPYPELEAKLDVLADRFKAVIVNDLERSGADPHDGRRDLDVDLAPEG